MPHDYTEDQLAGQPASGLLAELGWQTVPALEETFGPGGTPGRATKSEVVLTARSALRLAIEDTLDSGLPGVYAPELYRQKCSAVFYHVCESYPERNAGVYAKMA